MRPIFYLNHKKSSHKVWASSNNLPWPSWSSEIRFRWELLILLLAWKTNFECCQADSSKTLHYFSCISWFDDFGFFMGEVGIQFWILKIEIFGGVFAFGKCYWLFVWLITPCLSRTPTSSSSWILKFLVPVLRLLDQESWFLSQVFTHQTQRLWVSISFHPWFGEPCL